MNACALQRMPCHSGPSHLYDASTCATAMTQAWAAQQVCICFCQFNSRSSWARVTSACDCTYMSLYHVYWLLFWIMQRYTDVLPIAAPNCLCLVGSHVVCNFDSLDRHDVSAGLSQELCNMVTDGACRGTWCTDRLHISLRHPLSSAATLMCWRGERGRTHWASMCHYCWSQSRQAD
jgi:hypothetical protein